jgi:hypothetical protein
MSRILSSSTFPSSRSCTIGTLTFWACWQREALGMVVIRIAGASM